MTQSKNEDYEEFSKAVKSIQEILARGVEPWKQVIRDLKSAESEFALKNIREVKKDRLRKKLSTTYEVPDHWQPKEGTMRRFVLNRTIDESGISGTGKIASGVEFMNGKVALCWNGAVNSISVFDNLSQVEQIHGHNGNTVVEWID